MTASLAVAGAEATSRSEAVLQGVSRKDLQGRSLGRIAWMWLRREEVPMAGGVVFAPPVVKLFGHPPNEFHQDLVNPTLSGPLSSYCGKVVRHSAKGTRLARAQPLIAYFPDFDVGADPFSQ